MPIVLQKQGENCFNIIIIVGLSFLEIIGRYGKTILNRLSTTYLPE